MMPLKVSTNKEGDIVISQDFHTEVEVFITLDQVPILKQWLDEAVKDLLDRQKIYLKNILLFESYLD